MLEPELLHQQRPAGRDGGLGELQLADVALGQHHALGRVGVGALAVEHEDPLLADVGEPVGQRRARPPWPPRRSTNRPLASSSPTLTSSATASTRPEPHSPRGATSPITPSSTPGRPRPGVSLIDLDRAVGGAHAAADRAALERRPGRRRGRQDPLAVAEHDLAVGADVDEQPDPLVAVHAGGEHAGDDVAADVGAEGREQRHPRARVEREADLAGQHRRRRGRGLDERRHPERLGVDARAPARSSWRCRRAPPRRRDAGRRRPRGRPARPASASVAGRGLLQPAQRRRVEHRRADPRDHVAAERLLLVEHRGHRDRRAGDQVEQRRDHRGRAEVEGDRVADGRWCRRARRRSAPRRRSPR